MKFKRFLFMSLAVCVAMFAFSCHSTIDPDPEPEPEPEPEPVVDERSALEIYWDDEYAGPLGIQVEDVEINGKSVPRMIVGGKPLYITGMNCFNLFTQCHETSRLLTTNMERTVTVLKNEQVPIVRFSCSPFYDYQFHYYFDQREKYLEQLDLLGTLCDEAHVALIPSIFWNTGSVPAYYGESSDAWGDVNSQTYAHMLSYTEDIVNVLKKHKSLFMWEFGNEFSLAADIQMAGFPAIPARAVEMAYKGFAEKVLSLDPERRVVSTGNSIMRNSQWHQMMYANWVNDSFDEYVAVSCILTPEPMKGMSEHIYGDVRVFSDIGEVSRNEQVSYAQLAAEELGKVYYVGEFTGPPTAEGDEALVRSHLQTYLDDCVQLSLMWNYALKANIEWSFRADTPYGNMAFGLMREFNEKFKNISE